MNFFEEITTQWKDTGFYRNELLSAHTTFKVGGPADYFFEPASNECLIEILRILKKRHIPYFILGGGSNLVMPDKGFRGAVISTKKLDSITLHRNLPDKSQAADKENFLVLECAGGCGFSLISEFCEKNALSGFEEFCGLPGTAGGAVYMNARCYEKSISDFFLKAVFLDGKTFELQTLSFKKADWDYKRSPFQISRGILLRIFFAVAPGEKNKIREKNAFYLNDRKNRHQFDFPSAGSVFKNNRAFGAPSGKIIDQAGLLGLRLGGAQVAPWHGNFIINTGNASASDILKLTRHVQQQVKDTFSFELEPEILFFEE